jgi:hypothetical protein
VSILPAQHPAGKPPRGALTAGSLCTGYGGLDLAVMAVTVEPAKPSFAASSRRP